MSVSFDYSARGLIRSCPVQPRPDGVLTLPDALRRAVARNPDQIAVVGTSGRLSYGELLSVVSGVAARMRDAGIGSWDRVAACLPNDVDIVVAFLATMELGAIWTGIPLILSPPEKAFILQNAGVRLLWADAATQSQLNPFRDKLHELQHIWTDPASSTVRTRSLDVCGLDPFAPAIIAYTSGTTGFPKGAVHSQYNALLPGHMALEIQALGPGDTIGVVLPLTISNLMVLGPVSTVQGGAKLVCIDRTDPEGFAHWVASEDVVHLSAVPTIYHDILEHPKLGSSLQSLKLPETGGAEMPPALRDQFHRRFGHELQIGYGMTEAPTRVTWTFGVRDIPSQSCGRACAQLAIDICGPDGEVLAPGEVGEICVRPATSGPFTGQYAFFLGYWENPAATKEALEGGVLHTGDLGSIDDAGNVFIRGRKKELIIRGGSNVYPAEIERVLTSDDRLLACAVTGSPDRRLGERVVAFVQARPGAAVTAEELRQLCERNLARYKIPSEFRFVDGFPRNAMGKVVKAELVKMLDGS